MDIFEHIDSIKSVENFEDKEKTGFTGEVKLTDKADEQDNFFNDDNSQSNSSLFTENKSIFYTVLFYSFGLFIGSYLCKLGQNDLLSKIIKQEDATLLNLFLSDFCIYFSIFLFVVFLGFCLIGYPIINVVPLTAGLVSGIKISYYYIGYSLKGVGYSLIMLIPFTALFLTVIAFTIKISTELSQQLMVITKNKNLDNKPNIKSYLKKYFIIGIVLILSALINACLSKVLFSVVTI